MMARNTRTRSDGIDIKYGCSVVMLYNFRPEWRWKSLWDQGGTTQQQAYIDPPHEPQSNSPISDCSFCNLTQMSDWGGATPSVWEAGGPYPY